MLNFITGIRNLCSENKTFSRLGLLATYLPWSSWSCALLLRLLPSDAQVAADDARSQPWPMMANCNLSSWSGSDLIASHGTNICIVCPPSWHTCIHTPNTLHVKYSALLSSTTVVAFAHAQSAETPNVPMHHLRFVYTHILLYFKTSDFNTLDPP